MPKQIYWIARKLFRHQSKQTGRNVRPYFTNLTTKEIVRPFLTYILSRLGFAMHGKNTTHKNVLLNFSVIVALEFEAGNLGRREIRVSITCAGSNLVRHGTKHSQDESINPRVFVVPVTNFEQIARHCQRVMKNRFGFEKFYSKPRFPFPEQ